METTDTTTIDREAVYAVKDWIHAQVCSGQLSITVDELTIATLEDLRTVARSQTAADHAAYDEATARTLQRMATIDASLKGCWTWLTQSLAREATRVHGANRSAFRTYYAGALLCAIGDRLGLFDPLGSVGITDRDDLAKVWQRVVGHDLMPAVPLLPRYRR